MAEQDRTWITYEVGAAVVDAAKELGITFKHPQGHDTQGNANYYVAHQVTLAFPKARERSGNDLWPKQTTNPIKHNEQEVMGILDQVSILLKEESQHGEHLRRTGLTAAVLRRAEENLFGLPHIPLSPTE